MATPTRTPTAMPTEAIGQLNIVCTPAGARVMVYGIPTGGRLWLFAEQAGQSSILLGNKNFDGSGFGAPIYNPIPTGYYAVWGAEGESAETALQNGVNGNERFRTNWFYLDCQPTATPSATPTATKTQTPTNTLAPLWTKSPTPGPTCTPTPSPVACDCNK